MENLLTIETVPIKVEFVEKEPLKLSAVHSTQMEVKQDQDQQRIESKPIRIALQDSYEPSQNYKWENSTYTATSQLDDEGNLKLDISMEDGEAKAIRFKQANRSIDSMANQAAAIETGSMLLSIPIQQLSSGSQAAGEEKKNTELMLPDLELVVTQRPDVIIKYVGGPIYVPPSSDPNYQPPVGFEPASLPVSGILNEKV